MAKWTKSTEGNIEIHRVTMKVFELMVWKATGQKLWTTNVTVLNRTEPIVQSGLADDLLQAKMKAIHMLSHLLEDEHVELAQAMQETHNEATKRRDEMLAARRT
jgi:hypothetical protein